MEATADQPEVVEIEATHRDVYAVVVNEAGEEQMVLVGFGIGEGEAAAVPGGRECCCFLQGVDLAFEVLHGIGFCHDAGVAGISDDEFFPADRVRGRGAVGIVGFCAGKCFDVVDTVKGWFGAFVAVRFCHVQVAPYREIEGEDDEGNF